jgi:hypothetical protein
MPKIDQRGVLNNEVFTYRVSKDDKVFIYWNGKRVKILKGEEAQKFIARIRNLGDHETQLVMAKATGNFKHINERQ